VASTAQISKEKWQSIITFRQKIKNFESFRVQSQKPSSAMMKLALMRTATGKDNAEFSAAEDKFI
jgi:hypothetical protein